MQRIPLLSLVLFSLALGACGSFQTVKDSWKFTTRQYRTYLNTPASLDLEDTGSCELYELALSAAVIDVDEELQKLIRAMENSDHNPDQIWVMNIMNRIPWLSGVALVDNEGVLVAQYPEYFAKPFDASPLLEPDPKQRMGALRAYAQMTDAGPEIYLGNPVYGGEQLRGIIVAYFDPRVLVTMSSDPSSFMIACPGGVLWPGRYGTAGPVGSTDWAKMLTEKSCGIVGASESEFFWTTRYIGNLPIVYAMPTSAGREALLPTDEKKADIPVESTPLSDTKEYTEDAVSVSPATEEQAKALETNEPAPLPEREPAAAPAITGTTPEGPAQAEQGSGKEEPLAWPQQAPEFTDQRTVPLAGPKAAPEPASEEKAGKEGEDASSADVPAQEQE